MRGAAGDVGAAFRPPSISGCKLWLRADMGITLNGSTVSAWADQAPDGAGQDFVNGAAAAQPTYLASGGPLSRSAVDFDGSNDLLGSTGFAASGMITVSAWTTFIVARLDTITANSGSVWLNHCLWGEAEGYVGVFARSNGGTPEIYVYNFDGTADITPHIATSLDTWIVIEARHESGNIYCRVAGGAEQSAASGNTADDLAQISTLGLGLAGGAFLDGKLAEVTVFNRALSAVERSQVRAYLGAWHGLAV